MPIKIPGPTPGSAELQLDTPTRLVVVGANGSGKTRFGIWLEEKNHGSMVVHRISAQKALSLPERAPMKTLEQAEKDLLFGRNDQHAGIGLKNASRWGNNPATHLLSDYDALLAVLFAKDAERDRWHTRETRRVGAYVAVPDSVIDQIMAVWGDLMPHRSIAFDDGRITVNRGSPGEYHAKEMSDGERVALYLLGQCLAASPGTMLIIDEPELHLHRSLMDKLWNTVERLCPDKSIVYITHDLDFAASRADARKLWIQSFSGGSWQWVDVPADDAIPEALLLEIIGNRKPTLFCEGERGGTDQTIYQLCFPNLHVMPRGGSEQVVEATKALRANKSLHNLSAHGIVDRDVRTAQEIEALERQGVAVLRFAEIENLLCSTVVVQLVAAQLKLEEGKMVEKVREFVIKALSTELEAQVALRAARRIRLHLSGYTVLSNDPAALAPGIQVLLAGVDPSVLIDEERATLDAAIASSDLDTVLGVYNRKSILDRIAPLFGLTHGQYKDIFIRMLKSGEGEVHADKLRSLLPAF